MSSVAELERGLLGACICDPSALPEVADLLRPEHLSTDHHRGLLALLLDMHADGADIDLATVVHLAMATGGCDRYGGIAYVAGLGDRAPPTREGIAYYARRIRASADRRAFVACLQGAAARAADGEAPDALLGELLDLTRETATRGAESMAVVAQEAYDDVCARVEAYRAGRPIGLPIGLRALDGLMRLEPRHLVVLAARPRMGKTALAMNIAHAVACADYPVAYYQLEMSRSELAARQAGANAQIPHERIVGGTLSDDEVLRYAAASDDLAQLPLWVDDTPQLTVEQIRARAALLHARHPLALIIVDHIGLCAPTNPRDPRTRQIGHITGSLKRLAKELHVCVMALCQLNRALELRPDKIPILSDLRDSGEIEQDADVIAMLHRPEEYATDETTRSALAGQAKVFIRKHRSGRCGDAELRWVADLVRFGDPDGRRYI